MGRQRHDIRPGQSAACLSENDAVAGESDRGEAARGERPTAKDGRPADRYWLSALDVRLIAGQPDRRLVAAEPKSERLPKIEPGAFAVRPIGDKSCRESPARPSDMLMKGLPQVLQHGRILARKSVGVRF